MRVAILGAGFAGLSVSWYLLHYKKGDISIDLYDPEPIGGGVSGLSSGLLHSFAGKQARMNWRGDMCLKETHRLITEASRGIDRSVIQSKGILRPAVLQEQQEAFRACSEKHEETEWWDYARCSKEVPGLVLPESSGGLYIKNGLTVDVKGYLEGLWQTVAKLGVQYHQTGLIEKSELAKYDVVLVAIGAFTKNFPGLEHLPIHLVKGQIIDLEWPSGVAPLPFSLVSKKYLVMHGDQKSCTVGATFERDFGGPGPEQEKALAEIMPNITSYFPALERAKVLRCQAGFRASTPNHLPLVGQVSERLFFFTGLGSKGLLYHAYVGKRVARAILTRDPQHLPSDLV